MLGVLPFVEDPNFSWSAAPALPQHLPPWLQITTHIIKNTKLCVVSLFILSLLFCVIVHNIHLRGRLTKEVVQNIDVHRWDHVGCWLTGGSHALARRPPPSISMQYSNNILQHTPPQVFPCNTPPTWKYLDQTMYSNIRDPTTYSNNILQQYTTVKCFGSPFSSKYFAEILFQVFQWNKPPSTQIQQHTTSKYSASILHSSVESSSFAASLSFSSFPASLSQEKFCSIFITRKLHPTTNQNVDCSTEKWRVQFIEKQYSDVTACIIVMYCMYFSLASPSNSSPNCNTLHSRWSTPL